MKQGSSKHNIFSKIYRKIKFNLIKLMRSSDGAKKVSMGFAVGFGLEMLVIPTAYLMYIIFYPMVRLLRGSLPAAIIGNLIGKISFLPLILLPLGKIIGTLIYPVKIKGLAVHHHPIIDLFHGDFSVLYVILYGGLQALIGMSIIGAILGFISYHIIFYFYNKGRDRRAKKQNLA